MTEDSTPEVEAVNDLALTNQRRIQTMAAVGINIQGMREGYQTRLLEHLVGADLPKVRAAHELWVAEQLDAAEKEVARRKLQMPAGGFPLGGIKH
jgi:hypothetical protein